jgi:serine/threonine protein kinase
LGNGYFIPSLIPSSVLPYIPEIEFMGANMELQLPTLADGRYRIEGRLGEGGMAAVFRAYDTRLHVERAVKILSPELAVHAQIRDRFEVEASTMARLHHRNICMVHDIGTDGQRVFMVMEMLKGGSLMDRVEDHGVLHPQQAIDAAIAMAEGLGMAHINKIVHRDVKPHNVLISEDGVPKVCDFGIARLEDDNSGMTKTGAVMGTMSYMAPEQRMSARRATHQSDLYAVAASFYVCLTNGNPFDLYDEEEQDDLLKDIQPELAEFIRIGCHINPKKRHKDYKEMVKALEDLRSVVDPLPEGSLPLFVAHQGATKKKQMSEEDFSKLKTAWNNMGGDSPGPQNSGGDGQTIGFDLFGDDEEDEGAFTIAPGGQTIAPGQVDPTMVGVSGISQHSIPPLPQTTVVHKSNTMGMIFMGLLLVGVIAMLGVIFDKLETKPAETTEQSGLTAEDVAKMMADSKKEEAAAKEKAEEEVKAKAEAEAKLKAEADAKAKAERQKQLAEQKKNEPKPPTKTVTPPKKEKKSVQTPKPPIVSGEGSLVVRSVPGAQSITLDGSSVKLKLGMFRGEGISATKHKVVITSRDGQTHEGFVGVRANKTVNYCWNFMEGDKCQ